VQSGTVGNSAFSAANTANTRAIGAFAQANAAWTTANIANTIAIQSGVVGNSAFTAANTANTIAVQSGTVGNSAFAAANTANTIAVQSGVQANLAFAQANAAFAQANSSGGAGIALLDSHSITSNVASYSLTGIANTINTIEIFYDLIPATAGQNLLIRFYDSTGTEITSASYGWTTLNNNSGTAGVSGGGDGGSLIASPVIAYSGGAISNRVNDGGVSGRITMVGLQSPRPKRADGSAVYAVFGSVTAAHADGSVTLGYNGTAPITTITGFKLFFTSGNIMLGTVRVFGYT
jgi:hypothetical protein